MDSPDYIKRTEANVVDSDATAVFTYGEPTGGSLATIRLAEKYRRPCLHVDMNEIPIIAIEGYFLLFLDRTPELPMNFVLNVAGSRESKAPGISQAVMTLMVKVICELNEVCCYLPGRAEHIRRSML